MTILGTTPSLRLNSEESTQKIAHQLALAISPILSQKKTLIIWLKGDLGAGKTTLTRYLLKEFGYLGKVKSPTYALCETYLLSNVPQVPHKVQISGSFSVNHFDLYRMNHPKEWEEAGFRDIFFEPGLCLVEWAEKAEGTLPPPDLAIHLDYIDETGRELKIEALSLLGLEIISNLKSSN